MNAFLVVCPCQTFFFVFLSCRRCEFLVGFLGRPDAEVLGCEVTLCATAAGTCSDFLRPYPRNELLLHRILWRDRANELEWLPCNESVRLTRKLKLFADALCINRDLLFFAVLTSLLRRLVVYS